MEEIAIRRILVHVTSQKIGFLLGVARILAPSYRIVFLARDRIVKKHIERGLSEGKADIIVREDMDILVKPEDVIPECLKRETKYGESFSMISSYDRALGKGYLFNADRHPDVKRAWWSMERKYEVILKNFLIYEHILQTYHPVMILGEDHEKVLSLIAREQAIPYLSVGMIKYGLRFFWIENEHYQSRMLTSKVKDYVQDCGKNRGFIVPGYEQEKLSQIINTSADFSYRGAFKQAVKQIAVESYARIRGMAKKDSYRFLGWVVPMLRKPYMYRYFCRYGKRPAELKDFRVVYFPLHLEPEIALLSLSPELNNSMEIIAWISKSMPADSVLVVKEQPLSFGIRSKHYYDNLRRIPNVILAHPSIGSWDWIKASRIVATITGTAGIEAVYFGKPALSYGKHQIINHLPTVRYASDYESTRKSLGELLRLSPEEREFDVSKEALYRAQMDMSFELPGAERISRSKDPEMEMARIAVIKLMEQAPQVFESQE
jgi:hypothetical protein